MRKKAAGHAMGARPFRAREFWVDSRLHLCWIGISRSSAPLSSPSTRSSIASRAVSMSTGVCNPRFRRVDNTCRPSRPGSMRSNMTRANSSALTRKNPSSPVGAMTTSYIQPRFGLRHPGMSSREPATILASRTRSWLPSEWECRGQRLSTRQENPDTRRGLWPSRPAICRRVRVVNAPTRRWVR